MTQLILKFQDEVVARAVYQHLIDGGLADLGKRMDTIDSSLENAANIVGVESASLGIEDHFAPENKEDNYIIEVSLDGFEIEEEEDDMDSFEEEGDEDDNS